MAQLFRLSLALSAAFHAGYWLLHLLLIQGLRNLRSEPASGDRPLITILIAARDEEARLSDCLTSLLNQDYPPERTQIIVIDDRSIDDTPVILREFSRAHPGRLEVLRVDSTEPSASPKKHALGLGLKRARGEIILTTDADCCMGPRWASAMVAQFTEDTGMVLGFASFYPYLGGSAAIRDIQSLEFISYNIVAAALVGLGFPVHGNASNIAYRRRAFDEASGFSAHRHIASGDDDFLLQSVHRLGRWKIRYSIASETEVRTEAAASLGQFWEQRKRWAGKCGFYHPRQLAFLGGVFAYYSLILLCLLAGLFSRRFLALGAVGWAFKSWMDYRVMEPGTGIFGKRRLMRAFLPASLAHIPLIVGAVVAGSFSPFTWKRQRFKSRLD